MRWEKVALALGMLLLVLGFCLGVDTPISTTVAGRSHACDDVITAGMLVSGLPTAGRSVSEERTSQQRLDARVREQCAPLQRSAGWAIWGGLALGGLLLTTGWTALREREHHGPENARQPHLTSGG